MAERAESLYSAASTLQSRQPEGGIGQKAEKHPTPTLRIFGSNQGHQWLSYGGVTGGTQDYQPSPSESNAPPECRWFRFYYQGIIEVGGQPVMGWWCVTVQGSGLEKVAYEVGKHVKPTLMIGETGDREHPASVTAIRIEPVQIVRQRREEDDGEDD
ncbi:MAG: hypothetical protein U0835_00375 [Isosphaeraceae bacterium]